MSNVGHQSNFKIRKSPSSFGYGVLIVSSFIFFNTGNLDDIDNTLHMKLKTYRRD